VKPLLVLQTGHDMAVNRRSVSSKSIEWCFPVFPL
jgi:hypothetical protein